MYEQEQDNEQLESLDPLQSEDRLTVGNLTEGLSSIEKGLQILENVGSNEEHIFSTKRGIQKILSILRRNFAGGEKKMFQPVDYFVGYFMKSSTSK
ncbi:hypothetical protein TNCV_5095101 [Trichonephila clavipes]|nr:hypothetical protein TNCV_5095101 [Trichonephila clavipes]